MASFSQETISKFSTFQAALWQSTALAVSEAAGMKVSFNDPLTLSAAVNDLPAEFSGAQLIISFAFSERPENPQLLIISQDSLVDLCNALTGKELESVEDNSIAEIRPVLEGIVQGLCLAAGRSRNEAIAATGLSIRMHAFQLPQALQGQGNLVRVNTRISLEGVNGTVTWLLDEDLARYILNIESSETSDRKSGTDNRDLPDLGDSGLEMLLDIPLEVTVELGRLRMVVRDVVELGSGSIIEIDKAAGEPVDVMVNNRLVARGEVVVIEDNFGVRITEILTPSDRIARLNEVA
ncbi:flagellar motor switch protein FliN [Kamptonema cortianum]|nr:flagellar motor switch protein FliN [Geitlerinema splendidum]MDK3158729.1 flagellar motor switch protein FliN [Kamptonema cortianum]